MANSTYLSKKAAIYPVAEAVDIESPPAQYPTGFSLAHFDSRLAATFQGVNQWRTFQLVAMQEGALSYRVNNSATPAGWTNLLPLATATPPEVLYLPLESGVVGNPGYAMYYSKDQENKVLINCSALKNAFFASGDTIVTMPTGYRCGPLDQKKSASITTIEGVLHPAKVVLEASTGRIKLVFNSGIANVHQVEFEASYIAAPTGP